MKLLLGIYSFFSRLVCRCKRALLRKGGLRRPGSAPLPVLSVGNLTLGGSEKTPLAMDLLGFLLEIGRKPALVTRGYKSAWERTGGVLSDGRTIAGTWREGGDEPALAVTTTAGKPRQASSTAGCGATWTSSSTTRAPALPFGRAGPRCGVRTWSW